MRFAVTTALGLGLFAVLSFAGTTAEAEYYCSPGFVPSYGGRCIATATRNEIELYLNDPDLVYDRPAVRHRHHRRHGLRSRY